jgi:hypothetical protein
MIESGVSGKAKNLAGFKVLMDKMLEENAKAMAWSSAPNVQDCGGAGPSFNGVTFAAGFSCNQWEGDTVGNHVLLLSSNRLFDQAWRTSTRTAIATHGYTPITSLWWCLLSPNTIQLLFILC